MIPSMENEIDDESHHDNHDLHHICDNRQDPQPCQATGHIYGSAFPPAAYQRARHTQLQRIRMVMVMLMTLNMNMIGIRL